MLDSLEKIYLSDSDGDSIVHIRQAMLSPRNAKRTLVIVEAVEDGWVYSKFLDVNATFIYNPKQFGLEKGGYENVERIVEWFNINKPTIPIIGIRDRDYTLYVNPSHQWPVNIFVTDCRDIEMQMIGSVNFRALTNYTEDSFQCTIEMSQELGYLRIFNEVKDLGVIFRNNLREKHYWDKNLLSIPADWRDMFYSIMVNESTAVTKDEIENFIVDNNLRLENFMMICRGHDFIRIYCTLTNQTHMMDIGRADSMFQNMAAAYSSEDFKQTMLYKRLCVWQTTHQKSILL